MERAVLLFGQLLAHPRRSAVLVGLLLSPSVLVAIVVGAGWGGQLLLEGHLRAAAEIALDAAALSADPIEQERLVLATLEGAVWAPLRSHVQAQARAREGGLTLMIGCDLHDRSPPAVKMLLSPQPVRILRRSETGGS